MVLLDRKQEHGSWGFLEYYFCWIALIIGQWTHSCSIRFLYSMKYTRRIEQFCGSEYRFSSFGNDATHNIGWSH